MMITTNTKYNPIRFGDLDIGDVFRFNGVIYIKIASIAEPCSYTAMNLITNNRCLFIDIVVEKLDVELVIKGSI